MPRRTRHFRPRVAKFRWAQVRIMLGANIGETFLRAPRCHSVMWDVSVMPLRVAPPHVQTVDAVFSHARDGQQKEPSAPRAFYQPAFLWLAGTYTPLVQSAKQPRLDGRDATSKVIRPEGNGKSSRSRVGKRTNSAAHFVFGGPIQQRTFPTRLREPWAPHLPRLCHRQPSQ